MLAACSQQQYEAVASEQDFVATVNIQEPSIEFYTAEGELLTKWSLDKAYSGATLIDDDIIVLYGFQLETAVAYRLSTGEKQFEIKTGTGITNMYYAASQGKIYSANGVDNKITAYSVSGDKLKEASVGNYPMAMCEHDGLLYVVNYKDTKLSVLQANDLITKEKWEIAKSSHGIMIVPENNELWLGGHGEGSKPNDSVKIYDLHGGELKKTIKTPLMPIEMTQAGEVIYVVSHGYSELYEVNPAGEILWHKEIGANPFAVGYLDGNIILAGYDDHKLYYIKEHKIVKEIEVGKGPFQLLVREESF